MSAFTETINLLEHSSFFYIITVNIEGNYSYLNPHYNAVFSQIHGNLYNQHYDITIHPDDKNICEAVAAKCFAEPHKVFPATIRKHDGKGGYIITQWDYKAMFDEDGNASGMFCIGYDITQLVLQEVALNDAYYAIEKRNVVLQQIAFTQSHLIRMPLTNIMGLADIISKSDVDSSLKNVTAMLEESAKQLDSRIKEIVDNTHTV